MTEKDKQLIQKAESAGRFDWSYIDTLTAQAESSEARAILEDMSRIAFRSDEIRTFDL